MFSWDPAKAERNLRKHGISFEEAARAFSDPNAFDGPDFKHSQVEPRRLLIGVLPDGRIITVAYTKRIGTDGETTRIISARSANSRDRLEREHQRATGPRRRDRLL